MFPFREFVRDYWWMILIALGTFIWGWQMLANLPALQASTKLGDLTVGQVTPYGYVLIIFWYWFK